MTMVMRKNRHAQWDDASANGEPDDRIRVVLECPPEKSGGIIAHVIEQAGYAVRTCEGPTARHGCELIEDGSCALISEADVVVNMLGPRRDGAPVVEAVRSRRRPPAVVMEAYERDLEQVDLDPTGLTLLDSPVRTEALFAAIEKALGDRS